MARELTHGYALVGQISERTISDIVARSFLQFLPTVNRQVGSRMVNVWFKKPSAKLVTSNNPLQNIIEVQLPFTARQSDRYDECHGTLIARPSLLQVQVNHQGRTLIAPKVDFRGTTPTAVDLTLDRQEFQPTVREALVESLQGQPPITAGPLFPDSGRPFFFRSFTGANATGGNVLAIFIADADPSPPLPTTTQNHAGNGIKVLIPREAIDQNVRSGLAAQGLGTLPAVIPGHPDITLMSLAIELKSGHIFVTGSADKDIGPFTSTVRFKAWITLWIEDNAVIVEVARTQQDGDFLADFLDFFSAGAVTRALEDAIPAAVRSISGGAFGNLSLFANDVPLEAAFSAARGFGSVLIRPDGLGVPVALVDRAAAIPVEPPYIRAHKHSREFHIQGCEFGDLIKVENLRRFPTWQSAVQAGYDGCMTCQPEFNVSSYGELEVMFIGPTGAELPAPVLKASYAGNAIRFGVPIGRLVETTDRGHGQLDNNQVVHFRRLTPLVPGPWDMKLSWGTWEISRRIEVERRWVNAQGGREGLRTKVRAVHGESSIQVTYE